MRIFPEFTHLLNSYLAVQDRSPTWLAYRLGMSPSTVNRWLNHDARPGNPEVVERIADILAIHAPPERQALFAAAGYGYQEASIAPSDAAESGMSHEAVTQAPTKQRRGALWAGEPPFLVPGLPPQGILGREDLLAEISARLELDMPERTNVPPLALQGMGGVGKTTLAIALGRGAPSAPAAFSDHFPDGVLWVTVGPEPTIRNLLDDWGRALGVNLIAERNEEACRERLRSVLHHRRALLIVDDLWEASHGEYFMVAGPYCRLLLTTRESPVAYTLATRERTLAVDVLQPEAALELLRRLAPDAVRADVESARRLCERLEYLPLALTLAGRLLANEADVPTRMQRLVGELIERRAARLQLLQAEGRLGLDREQPVSLEAVLGMSIARLNRTDQARFAMLAVFGAEPLTWELDAAAHVWVCSVEEAEVTVAHFIQRGLVLRRGAYYWTHALLADYAAEMMESMSL